MSALIGKTLLFAAERTNEYVRGPCLVEGVLISVAQVDVPGQI